MGKFIFDTSDRSVVDDASMIDNHQALTNLLNIRHVMGGKQDGNFSLPVELADEGSEALLCDHIDTDGRLVEEEDVRIMK